MEEAQAGDRTWIDEAATRFDRAWKAGEQPLIEDYLAGVVGPRRLKLLEELLRIERELRGADGTLTAPEEYRRRFPGASVRARGQAAAVPASA